jgi:hypothetical protein
LRQLFSRASQLPQALPKSKADGALIASNSSAMGVMRNRRRRLGSPHGGEGDHKPNGRWWALLLHEGSDFVAAAIETLAMSGNGKEGLRLSV